MPAPRPVIAPGSADTQAVLAAQRELNILHARERSAERPGLTPCPLVEDGVFGVEMGQAVLEAQLLFGLVPIAIVDADTWARLDGIANPASGVSSGAALPLEGVPRWSVGFDDILAATGRVPSPEDL